MSKRLLLACLCVVASMAMMAANTVTTKTSTITSAQTVSTAVDYTISAATPFSGNGSVNITNTNQAVVIFKSIKPSVVISTWLKYIKINGVAAANGTNCQVKMYGQGAIILPYVPSTIAPLTCYSGTNFTGTSNNSYSIGHNGGYMRTLTTSQLLNNMKSFKLKRGYMVTFATGTNGWGYSRCFIADKADLEINLPTVLAGKVSSYRLFEWFNFGKSGIANDTRAEVVDALNLTSCYSYGCGEDRRPDAECIPHKIHKNWPGVGDCGSCAYSAHMKTDNEPANSADDTPATVAEVLGYWEDAMRTGMRLASPSSYDGGYAWQTEFMNAIDARGWRCDVLDMHCYWVTSSFNSLQSYYDKFHRPIWVTEWLWGASWNSNGAFGSGVSDNTIISETNNILSKMNSAAYVERYHYWNSESKAKIYDGGITSLGQQYAKTDGGLGYNSSYEFVPVVVIKKPYSLSGNVTANAIDLTWKDANGDMMDQILLQYKSTNSSTWTTLQTIDRKDKTSRSDQIYTYVGTMTNANKYCWRVVDMYDGQEYPSDVLLSSADVTDNSNVLPSNLTDYYFQFYSKEASANLCWAVYPSGNSENRVYYKAANSNYGNDMTQLWTLEVNSNGGYSFRNASETGYLIASPNSWNFVTRNDDYKVEAAKTAFSIDYYSSGDYWIVKNLAHNTYVGLWDADKTFAEGEVLAGNRSAANSGTDSGDKIGIRLIPRSVVNDKLGIITVPSGTYYLYNQESGYFISSGGSWGTHAIVDDTGIDFTLSPSGTGYTLESNISNGGVNHYLGSNTYADSEPYEWTFGKAGTINGKQAYTISDGTNYLCSNGTKNTNLTTTTNANSNYAKWLLYTREDLMALLATATKDNPVNATFLLPSAQFNRNDGRFERWNGGPVRGGYAGSDWSDMNAEKFNTAFDIYQTLTNIPDGIYKVDMQGFYRNGGYADAATSRTNGNEALNAMLYANDETVTIPSIFEGAGKCGTVGVSTTFGYVPNGQSDASNYIYNGLYKVPTLTVTVEGGTLTVGVKKTNTVTNDWTIFDNFKLTYLGAAYTPGDVTNNGFVSLSDGTALISILLGRDNTTPYKYNHKAADVNSDGSVNMQDLYDLLNLLLNK